MAKKKKGSTLTLRLTGEENNQLQKLKDITKIKTGTTAILYAVNELPVLKAKIEAQAKEAEDLRRQLGQYRFKLNDVKETIRRLINFQKIAI